MIQVSKDKLREVLDALADTDATVRSHFDLNVAIDTLRSMLGQKPSEPTIKESSIVQSIACDYDMSIHTNPDAQSWAKFFIKTQIHTGFTIDEELMTGWFANAMMAMHDHLLLKGQPINGDHAAFLMEQKPSYPDTLDEMSTLRKETP
jgi:hypothetical protein